MNKKAKGTIQEKTVVFSLQEEKMPAFKTWRVSELTCLSKFCRQEPVTTVFTRYRRWFFVQYTTVLHEQTVQNRSC